MEVPLNYIKISKDNLISNLNEFKKILPKEKKFTAVVKANAYGHGDKEITKLLNNQVDYFQVDDYLEFLEIQSFAKKPILILGYISPENLENTVEKGGIPAIFDIERARILNAIGKKKNQKVKFHLKIDALLGRQGVLLKDLPLFLKELKNFEHLKITGVYSHFNNADSTEIEHTKKQVKHFQKATKLLKSRGIQNFITHMSATAGLLELEQKSNPFDMVRLGIGLYGLWPSKKIKQKYDSQIKIKPVLKWISHLVQVKTLPKNYPIGYNLTHITKRKTKIGVVPQGYSDGFDRKFSNSGKVLIKNKYCPILGRVAMNLFIVDISKIQNVSQGEKVIIIGPSKEKSITAQELAQELGTINYEITSRISPLLPRLIR